MNPPVPTPLADETVTAVDGATPRLGRRRVVQLGAAAVTGVLALGGLAACGDDEDKDGDEGAAPPSSAAGMGVTVAKVADVPVGTTIVVDGVEGDPLVLYRESETSVKAFSAKCTHKFCPVKPAGAELDCPCHGSKFDAKTGAKISGIAETGLPARSVAIKGEDIVTA